LKISRMVKYRPDDVEAFFSRHLVLPKATVQGFPSSSLEDALGATE
jgi:hypothetical protein